MEGRPGAVHRGQLGDRASELENNLLRGLAEREPNALLSFRYNRFAAARGNVAPSEARRVA